MRNFDTIIVHCSATPPNWMMTETAKAKRDEIDRWHKDRGWSGIGYHYIIDRDGKVETGRHLNKTGAHVKGHNTGSIGICLLGGRWPDGRWGLATDRFSQHFTPAQDRALRGLIADIQARYPAVTKITGHNDYTDAKGCPCFKVADWLAEKPASDPPSQRGQRAAGAGTGAPPAQRNPIVALLNAIFKALGLGRGGPV